METFLDHIAIAVKDIEDSIKIYEALGLQFSEHREVVESQGVKTAFAKVDQKAKIELLESISDDSSIAKFIKKRGEGIHHLCFRVADLKSKQVDLEAKGFVFTSKKPFEGADSCLVNFIHPKSTGGTLIELSQKLKG